MVSGDPLYIPTKEQRDYMPHLVPIQQNMNGPIVTFVSKEH